MSLKIRETVWNRTRKVYHPTPLGRVILVLSYMPERMIVQSKVAYFGEQIKYPWSPGAIMAKYAV